MDDWDPERPLVTLGRDLQVQPILMVRLPTPKAAASWKSWGGIQTEAAVAEEVHRIQKELEKLGTGTDLGVRFLPVATVTSVEQARELADRSWDVTLLYACTGTGDQLNACLSLKRDNVIFVRHQSGPVYYWYEALSTRLLATDGDTTGGTGGSGAPRAHVDDVVVDDPNELAGKLRALRAVRNFLGSRIVALGGPWGKYAADAPQKAQERFGLEIVDVSYEDFGPRVLRALDNRTVMERAEKCVDRYLALPHTALQTDRRFVVNAFVLYELFKTLMAEHDATAFTIKSCMGTILPMAQTTACLTLGLLNDDGLIAFCESDFVIIPPGLLFRHLAGRPVFLHNSTFPHHAIVTCAHCTSPRRMDGRRLEPVQLVTHYESEYGAATKVEMPIGQEVTFIDPQYSTTRWLGFKGIVKANPALAICRSQQDVEVQGNWKRLVSEVRDSHWVMAYGDHLAALGYAARKIGIQWVDLTAAA